jgi:hypothetical protein
MSANVTQHRLAREAIGSDGLAPEPEPEPAAPPIPPDVTGMAFQRTDAWLSRLDGVEHWRRPAALADRWSVEKGSFPVVASGIVAAPKIWVATPSGVLELDQRPFSGRGWSRSLLHPNKPAATTSAVRALAVGGRYLWLATAHGLLAADDIGVVRYESGDDDVRDVAYDGAGHVWALTDRELLVVPDPPTTDHSAPPPQ